jgi:hypothetical protein
MKRSAAIPPEDDPFSVALVAAQLIGRTCKEWEEAIIEARRVLILTSDVIKCEKADEESDPEVQNDIRLMPMPEQVFIDQMVKGLCIDKKFARRKEFLFRMWPKLQAIKKSAPTLEPQIFTEATLEYYQGIFRSVCHEHAKEVRRANAKKPRKKRSKIVLAAVEHHTEGQNVPEQLAGRPHQKR